MAPACEGRYWGAVRTMPGKHKGLLRDEEPGKAGARHWYWTVWEVQVREPTGGFACAGAGALYFLLSHAAISPLHRRMEWPWLPRAGPLCSGTGVGKGAREMGALLGCL